MAGMVRRKSTRSGYARLEISSPLLTPNSWTVRSEPAKGNGRMSTASTTLNTAVVTPIPSTIVTMTAAVVSGVRAATRSP